MSSNQDQAKGIEQQLSLNKEHKSFVKTVLLFGVDIFHGLRIVAIVDEGLTRH